MAIFLSQHIEIYFFLIQMWLNLLIPSPIDGWIRGLSMDGHMVCFQIATITNKGEGNILSFTFEHIYVTASVG